MRSHPFSPLAAVWAISLLGFTPACIQKEDEPKPAALAGGGGFSGQAGSSGSSGSGHVDAATVGQTVSNCSGVAVAVTSVAAADVTSDTTWSGTVFVSRPVNVQNGATLTI